MLSTLIFSLALLTSPLGMAASLLTFKEWRQSMVDKASNKGNLYAVEAARALTVSDYFAGYVNRLEDRQAAIKTISKKLTHTEVESLMETLSRMQQDQRPMPQIRPSAFENHDPIR